MEGLLKIFENSKTFKGSDILNKKDNHILCYPLNNWDTNYRLYDLVNNKTYLISTEDIHDNEENLEEYGGVLWQDLKCLEDVEEIKEVAWKIEK